MTARNGHAPATDHATPDPRVDIARGLYESQLEEGDALYADLDPDQREDLEQYVGIALNLHLQWLSGHGFRIIPPGAVPVPHSKDEAAAMLKATRAFIDGQKRKGGLVTGAAGRKVILPKEMKLQ